MINYYIYKPGGNTTALVEMEDGGNLPAIAKKIMESNPTIEQVGFLGAARLKNTDFHLQMMGGEFCGNAARCAALHLASVKNKSKILFTVSGFDAPVSAIIRGSWVELNLPGSFLKNIRTLPGGQLVSMEGISFFVTSKPLSFKNVKAAIKKFGKSSAAAGVIIIKQTPKFYGIIPWVWVGSTKTLVAETACASGSLAAAIVFYMKDYGKSSYLITQPSGERYQVKLTRREKNIFTFSLSGPVERLTNLKI
jgi:diaminopimelate epimerase